MTELVWDATLRGDIAEVKHVLASVRAVDFNYEREFMVRTGCLISI
jgi:hypothetical protein